jgi:hypothetical protein
MLRIKKIWGQESDFLNFFAESPRNALGKETAECFFLCRECFVCVTPKNFNYCFNKILLSNKCLFKDS